MALRLGVAFLISGWIHYMLFSHNFNFQFQRAQIQLQTFPSSLDLYVTSPAVPRVKEVRPKKEEKKLPPPIQTQKESAVQVPVEKKEEKKVEVVEEKVEKEEPTPKKEPQAASVGSIKQGALQPAVLEGQAPPTYPMLARARKIEGKVLLAIQVLESGLCGRVEVKESSGHSMLDQAAVEGVRKWRFEPAQKEGKPIQSQIEIPIIFRLNE